MADSLGAGTARSIEARLLVDADHYRTLVCEVIENASVSVWVATANVKEMMVEAPVGTRARAAGRYVSVLETFARLARRGVETRLLHASRPSRPFALELARHGALRAPGFQMKLCPRVHLKLVAVDGRLLYLGSANFTGAGLGAKGDGRRNFEMGILTDDDVMLDAAQARFDRVWRGAECGSCRTRSLCPAPLDQAPAPVRARRPGRRS